MPNRRSGAEASPDQKLLAGFLGLAGGRHWSRRMEEIGRQAALSSLTGRAAQERHALELLLQRLSSPDGMAGAGAAERQLLTYVREAVHLANELPAESRQRLRARILSGLTGEANLIPLFHLLRVAALHRARGFEVRFTGLADGTPHDLLISRNGAEAEVVCDTISAEEGRHVLRGDWCMLVDGINPDLQTWLAAHPGRYVLKMTLPEGLRADALDVAALQRRIVAMLRDRKRQDSAADAVLKLDPLILAGAQAAQPAASLRALFGPEAHLAVAHDKGNMLVLAAQAGRASDIAQAACRRMATASERLSGQQAGILAVFLDDMTRQEWRGLREQRELEGTVRRFLTTEAARRISAVSCASRMEMFGMASPDAVVEGELRFRNPGCTSPRDAALLPALSSL
jgi:hypothetical protein